MTGRVRGSRTNEVMEAVRARLAGRMLAAGERLPSIRKLAGDLGVSPSTVVEAYDRLAAEGLIRARRGSGFYAANTLSAVPLVQQGPKLDLAVDPFWVSRQSLDAEAAARPGCGWLPPDWMPTNALRRAIRGVSHAEDSVLCNYGPTHGPLPLRRLLARQFAEEGLAAGADQILLTGSDTQALDLICRLLLRPGDRVLVDDPCYFNFRALLSAHGVSALGVPYTASGPDIERFTELAVTYRPRLYITNSALHNPTGATMAPATAHQLLKTAAAQDMMVVEDDILCDFEPERSPRLAVLDGLSRVIRIGSWSKTLSASIRCGYVVAGRDLIEGLIDLQVATSFGGVSPVAAQIVFATLSDGGYRKHIEALQRRLARARRDTTNRLEPLGIRPWLMPRGGFYLWCHLPARCDASDLARAALRENVVLAPGDVFSVSGTASGFMRINVAQMESRVFEVLERALAEVRSGAGPSTAATAGTPPERRTGSRTTTAR